MLSLTNIISEVLKLAMATGSNRDSKFGSLFFTFMAQLLSFQLFTLAGTGVQPWKDGNHTDKKWPD